MRKSGIQTASIVGVVVALALLAGCEQLGGVHLGLGDSGSSSDSTSHPCNTAEAGVIGALAGSLFGKGKGHVAGAVIGAGIGAFACMVYNYHERKLRDAQTVEAQYRKTGGALPTTNTVEAYHSELLPGQTVQAGSQATMQSDITVLQGTKGATPKLKEQLTLYSPEGKQLSTVTKDATSVDGTGEYQTDFVFNLPKGIQEGRYTVQSTLYMNGEQVRANKVPMLVVA